MTRAVLPYMAIYDHMLFEYFPSIMAIAISSDMATIYGRAWPLWDTLYYIINNQFLKALTNIKCNSKHRKLQDKLHLLKVLKSTSALNGVLNTIFRDVRVNIFCLVVCLPSLFPKSSCLMN